MTTTIHMLKEDKNRIYSSLVLATIFAVMASPRNMGNIHALGALVLLVWVPYSIIVIATKPDRRASQLPRAAIWIVAFALVAGIHYWRTQITWKNANEIVAAVNEFTAKHGHCPATLGDVGVDRVQLRDKLGIAVYGCDEGKPWLIFKEPYGGFGMWNYDFAAHSWQFHPD